MSMTPAERVALLRSLATAVKIVSDEVAEELVALAESTGSDRWRTQFGEVRIDGGKKWKATITDTDAFLAWVEAEHPHEIRRSVSTPFRTNILSQLAVADDVVIDQGTGEVVPWATPQLAPNKVVASAGEQRDATIASWEDLLRSRLDEIAADSTKALP